MGIKESYTSASVFPTKLLHNKVVDENGKIIPIHIQLSPTNACNLNCSFCSCGDVDRKKKLTLEEIKDVVDISAQRGTKSMTITGGGEPLLHPNINEIINYADSKGIEAGLVTTGTVFKRLKHHNNLTWCRISSSDDRIPSYRQIIDAIKVNPQTDWAFSHVVTRSLTYPILRDMIQFVNSYDFTHVRLVSNLFDLEKVLPMEEIRNRLGKMIVDDSKVIYQGRKVSTKGTKDCYISLLKPVIAPEGIFPCCGVQYAMYGQKRDMISTMRMGKIKDLSKILDKQKQFNGSVCDVCYYSQYNDALEKILNRPEHANFI